MNNFLASLRAPSVAVIAVATLLAVAPRVTHAGDPGTWQSLYGPWQNHGAIALDGSHRRLFAWGGDNTDVVHLLPLNGYPYTWQTMATLGTPPSIRSGHSLVYDSVHNRLIVFGGSNRDGSLNDVWELTLDGTPTWSELTPTGTAPDPRNNFGACYDPVSGTMFVFGGLDNDGNVEPADLYALDLSAGPPVWSMPAQFGTVPSGRWGSPLAINRYTRRLFLFGGDDGGGLLNDECEYDLSTQTWTSDPTSGIVPDWRMDHVCVSDDYNSLLVWGGSAGDDSIRALDLTTRTWAAQSYFIGPPTFGNQFSLGVFDDAQARVLVLAGDRGAEAWEFQRAGSDNYWYPLGPTAYPFGHSMVVDRAHNRAVEYGGTSWQGNFVRQDFWEYRFTPTLGWNGVNTGGVAPPSRADHLAVWDESHDRMLVICGRDENLAYTNSVYALQDSADFMNWIGLAPTGTPPSARAYPAGIYDPVGGRVLLYGGLDNLGMRGGLYQLSLSGTPAWSVLARSGGPNGRAAASAIYDAPRHRMILFGGIDSLGTYTNDVWALNLPGATWTHLAPTGTPPAGRWKHTAVYDSRRERMVVFGGRVGSADDAEAWELDLASATPAWNQLVPSGYTPFYRSEAAAVYDSLGDRMLVYGGISLVFSYLAVGQQDLVSLQFGGSVVGVTAPAPRSLWMVGQPSPNPSRTSTRLSFELSRATDVKAAVYDVAGRRLKTLADGLRPAGRNELAWDGRDAGGRQVPSGVYFYRLELGGSAVSRKISLVR